ncbi:uroporphyrin-III C-methyltransferase/precorrin-2 dehydrogenase/sirohydrochlorin ferrochelatase/precorrin-2 dehydrogenase/sirohydrochlorin ferrochelatase [Lachnotalea glycerini]|jgi:precorrin-2 dehydrogenase / sirohydrochlorin ferrochelatase|uniref:precorrin-2 dehydrogenase n=1 Tax=Lachnotalea glycerini TaxID=1763509 RepID=A0A255IHJ8_9FIRM|nr:bifunctional precorrin-2 dehydrogenase/sirohydrochlorin ferrochelatase [Lachnotalea glycerini]OYO59595.1 hypothetical protein CG709_18550 [Lachnotalea glycerini]PXV89192.1 uroporphyrin-III C-methyltransferase/precorrin-2 dehydrogenase/sirohydrochlorin ferrochelatase/precorrin-2 dehydrogenase/sirohydrochlorin ferrochelatase [Lachnotalea glycerini]RDY31461.1 bifunctional precorrin-2 dehydrogenase/sirohydrochlorin ferrochelatase [Lachnotalea glycerini]
MAYFPMFIELKNKPCLIVGGGTVAYRKVIVLKDFEADITVVSSTISEKIRQCQPIICKEKEFEEADLEGMQLVIAATDDEQTNHDIALLCKMRGIAVNAVDQIEDCSFIFGSYVKEKDVVAAISSAGKSPVITQYLRDYMQQILTEEIGEMADFLGDLRPRVKEEIVNQSERKKVYQDLLAITLEKKELPQEEEIEAVMKRYKSKTN